jgi:hypothetical protein
MSPTETIQPSSGVATRLRALGAECDIGRCPDCGGTVLDGTACACCEAQLGAGRLRFSLVEALDGDLTDRGAASPGRLRVRGEVIA